MWIPQTSSLSSLDEMFLTLHALSGAFCLLAKKWLLMKCWWGWVVGFGLHRTYHQSKYKSDAGTMLTWPAAQLSESSPVTCEKKCIRKAEADTAEPLRDPRCTQTPSWYCSTAVAVSSMTSPSREDLDIWVITSERLARPDIRVHWRLKTGIVKNQPCSSTGSTCPTWHQVKLKTLGIQQSDQQQQKLIARHCTPAEKQPLQCFINKTFYPTMSF